MGVIRISTLLAITLYVLWVLLLLSTSGYLDDDYLLGSMILMPSTITNSLGFGCCCLLLLFCIVLLGIVHVENFKDDILDYIAPSVNSCMVVIVAMYGNTWSSSALKLLSLLSAR